jgi:hypothetical protein
VAAVVHQKVLRNPHMGEVETLQRPDEAAEAKPATFVNRLAEFPAELLGE